MTIAVGEALLIALGTGVVTGLVTWGGIRVQLQWLRRDVDLAHDRITRHEYAKHDQTRT